MSPLVDFKENTSRAIMSAEQDEFSALQESLRVAKTLKEQNEQLNAAFNDV